MRYEMTVVFHCDEEMEQMTIKNMAEEYFDNLSTDFVNGNRFIPLSDGIHITTHALRKKRRELARDLEKLNDAKSEITRIEERIQRTKEELNETAGRICDYE